MNIIRRYTPFYFGHSLTDIFFRKRWQNFFHNRCFRHSTDFNDPEENIDPGSVRETEKKINLLEWIQKTTTSAMTIMVVFYLWTMR